MIPGVLILAIGAVLLYAAFHVNREVLVITDERPKLAFATATGLAVSMQGSAVRYRQRLGRWPATPADVNLDEKWMSAHRGIESVSYGANGSVHAHLSAAIDGPATWIVWTPRDHGERVLWDCASDHPGIAKILDGCVTADASMLAMSELEDTSEGRYVDVPGLDERCQALGKVGYAAAKAREEGDPIQVFVRRPVVAFVNDEKLRAELEDLARWVYASPARAPSATQREVLTQYRCKAS
jgi:hypothetical protein